MKRVAYFTESFGDGSKGGGSLSSLDFVLLLKKQFDFIDVYHIGKCKIELDKVKFIRIKRPNNLKLNSIRNILKTIFFQFVELKYPKPKNLTEYTQVFINSWPSFFRDYAIVNKNLNSTIVLRGSTNFFDFFNDNLSYDERRLLYTRDFTFFQNIIFVSKNISSSWIEFLNYKGNYYYLPNTVDNSLKEFTVVKAEKYTKDICINILIVGSVQHRKNQAIIEYSVKRFIELNVNVIFHIVGSISKTHGGAEIRKNFIEFTNVVFHGHQENVMKFIQEADICLLTSKAEALPRSLLEYIKFGKLVVASNIDGNSEIIIDGETGFLFDPNDGIELFNILISLIERIDSFDYIKLNAIQHYNKNYSRKAQENVFNEICRDLMNI